MALLALASYVGLTWSTANKMASGARGLSLELWSGQVARAYFDNLRADLTAARQTGVQPSILDHDVPKAVLSPLANLNLTEVTESPVRFSLLSSVVPLFEYKATFNQPGRLHIVQANGHLKRTRFVAAAGGSPAELRRTGRLALTAAHVERPGGEWCVTADGLSTALEWEPRPHLRGRDWWLRARYRTDPVQPFWLETNAGGGWVDEGAKLPPMGFTGTRFVDLTEPPDGGTPTNAGIRLKIPVFGRLCLRSLAIGYFDPPPPPP